MPWKRHLYAASRVKRQIHRLASQHMLSTLLCCVLRRAVDAPHNGALDLLLLYKSVSNKCGFSKFVSYESSMAAGIIFLDNFFIGLYFLWHKSCRRFCVIQYGLTLH